MLKTILITNDPVLACEAEEVGVARLMVDIESMGKKERQASRSTFISTHTLSDVAVIRKAAPSVQLIVRINPWHHQSGQEIGEAISDGADLIMLPMITTLDHIHHAHDALKGKATLYPLLETAFCYKQIESIAGLSWLDEVYIGLNDLHLSLGLDFLFEPLANGVLDHMVYKLKQHGKRFGFGGIGALSGQAELPASAVLAEHARLGSSCVILSSRFAKDCALGQPEGRKERLISALRDMSQRYDTLCKRGLEAQAADFVSTRAIIETIASQLRAKRKQA